MSDFKVLASALQMKGARQDFTGNCPVCGYKQALRLIAGADGRPFLWCHAGNEDCSGPLFDLKKRLLGGCAAPRAAVEIGRRHADEALFKRAAAREVWHRAGRPGAVVRRYWAARGLGEIDCRWIGQIDGLAHAPSRSAWPAMIAAVVLEGDGLVAVHRTWLLPDGSAKAAVTPAKMTLGPCRGAAVQLAEARPDEPLVLGEGIETTAAAMKLTGLPGWACLSTSGLIGVVLPPGVRRLVIAADGDEPGLKAAEAAAKAQRALGRSVEIVAAPLDGSDWADAVGA